MATNMYIKFVEPDIAASSSAGEHAKEIEVLSWSHGFVQPTSPTRSTSGSASVEQATHQNLSFTKYLDAGSTELLRACWGGQQFKQVLLTCYRSDGAKDNKPVQYLKVDMQHVIVANYSVSGGPGDVPVENVSLDYGVIQYTYAEQKHEDGKTGSNLPATHNLETRVIS